jgi:hypothetical protein
LIAVLEDGGGARGLIALSHGTVDALVEVQTTGRVDPRELPPRPVTRIDEALCRDFIDLCLAAFSRETREVEDRDWPERLSFGSRIADPGQLGLLLPDRDLSRAVGRMSRWARRARAGAGGACSAAHAATRCRAPSPPRARCDPEAWRKALEQAMAEARDRARRRLVRTTRSLRDLEAMGPGDLIGFDPADLASVRLETFGNARAARAARPDRRTARAPDGRVRDSRAVRYAGRRDRRARTCLDGHARRCRRADVDGTWRRPRAGPGRRRPAPRPRTAAAGPADAPPPVSRRRPRRWISRPRPRRSTPTPCFPSRWPAGPGHCNRRVAASVSRRDDTGGGRRHVDEEFRTRVMDGTPLAGTFMKTPAVDVLEVLILGGLDFVCLDAEHAPFDRAALNALCAVARAADFPVLVRVPSGSAEQIGMALDAGAHGIVVPHVTDARPPPPASRAPPASAPAGAATPGPPAGRASPRAPCPRFWRPRPRRW